MYKKHKAEFEIIAERLYYIIKDESNTDYIKTVYLIDGSHLSAEVGKQVYNKNNPKNFSIFKSISFYFENGKIEIQSNPQNFLRIADSFLVETEYSGYVTTAILILKDILIEKYGINSQYLDINWNELYYGKQIKFEENHNTLELPDYDMRPYVDPEHQYNFFCFYEIVSEKEKL